MTQYPTKQDNELIKAITLLKNEGEIRAFLRDILTPGEIEEFASRFQVATLLWTTKLSYIVIAKKVGTSTATVTRVSHWVFKERWQGYAVVLQRIYGEAKR